MNHNVGFTVVAVLCLALGICASITVFSIVNFLLLRPIPGVIDQERLVLLTPKPMQIEEMGGETLSPGLSYPDFLRYREETREWSGLVAYQTIKVNLAIRGELLRVDGQVVTDNYFTTLGLRPAAGRFFAPGEGAREGQPEVVVSHALWRRVFIGRQGLGSSVKVNGQLFAVIGTAPPGFTGIQHDEDLSLWIPMESVALIRPDLKEDALRDPDTRWLFSFFGRQAPGVDLQAAQRGLDLASRRFGESRPPGKQPSALQLHPGLGVRPGARDALGKLLALLAIVVGLLMLVVCANLGTLLLVRAAARQEEIGVRLALGVSRGQLIRQLLAESVTLSLIGGAVGFVLSLWTVDALQGIALGRYLPRVGALSIDGRIVAFTIAVSLGAGALFGLLPAIWATRRQVSPLLRRGNGNGGLERGSAHLQKMFVIAQVTLSLMLLITTGLFVRTLQNLQSIDPGFDSSNVLNLHFNLALQRYSEESGARLYEQLLAQVSRMSGVRAATLVSWVPLSNGNEIEHWMTLRPHSGAEVGPKALMSQYGVVVPGYFRSLGIPLLRGQDFSKAHRQGSSSVIILDETLADLLWPGKDPIGEQVDLELGGRPEIREVIGVARAIRLRSLQEAPQPYFYLPFAQHYEPAMTLQVRTMKDPQQVVEAIRSILHRQNPDLSFVVSRFDREVEETLAQPRLLSWLLGSFSLTALFVTAMGLYGTLAYAVSRRTRELGIRMVLGARGFEIVRMVLRRGLALTLTGLVLGLMAASWATSAISGLLYGVTPTDPGVFLFVALLLILVGLAASSVPAYSATRVDPMAVIRHE
jgi:predicted permease